MAWQQALGWDQGSSRRLQLSTGISGLVILFCGVVMQWWAGDNISDIDLGTFCTSYSGRPEVMTQTDWNMMKMEYYNKHAGDGSVLDLATVARTFFGARTFNSKTKFQIEAILYADASFWCKYLPTCPPGSTCVNGAVSIEGPTPASGVFKGRAVSDKPFWNLPANAFFTSSSHIRCYDKFVVYRDMLGEVFTDRTGAFVFDDISGNAWTQNAIDAAAGAVLYSCYGSKGSNGYILGLGPLLSSLACVFCFVSMFTCCPRSYSAALGRGLAVMAFAMTLIGFWVVGFSSINEFLNAYIFCQDLGPPLVDKGVYFDGTPCIDRASDQSVTTNPFVYWSGFTTGVYTVGGVFNIIATILLLISIAKTLEDQQLRKFTTLDPSDEL